MMDKGIEDYVFQTRLGSGAFAQVFRAQHRLNGSIVAVKMIDVYRLTERNSKLKENLNYEIKILKAVSHPNIVTLYDVLEPPPPQNESYIYMVMECCEGGDFSKYIRKHKRLTEEKAKYFMKQLANGLKFLRANDIIHRDLKPQNLLLSDSGDTPILKIADFGFARFIDVQSLSDTFCGSPLYMAPEILHRKNYTVKADLWSVGVILYEMLVGEPPFNCVTVVDLLQQLETNRIKIPSSLSISRECQDLMYSLLQTNEMNRLSWEDFFQHPWLGFSQNIGATPQFIYQPPSNTLPHHRHSTSAPNNPTPIFSSPQSQHHQPYHLQQQQQNIVVDQQPPLTTMYKQQHQRPIYNPERTLNRSRSFTENNNNNNNNPLMTNNNIPTNIGGVGGGGLVINRVYNNIQQEINQLNQQLNHQQPYQQQQQQPIPNEQQQQGGGRLLSSKKTSTSSIDFESSCIIMDDEEYINSIERIGKRALAIAELGDLRQFESNECLALYVKALLLIKTKLQQNVQQNQNQSFGSSNLYKYNCSIDKLKDIYQEYLSKTITIYNQNNQNNLNSTSQQNVNNNNSGINLNNSKTSNSSSIIIGTNSSLNNQQQQQLLNCQSTKSFSVNKHIYESALEMGRNGGLEEMYRDFNKSIQLYSDGLLLLDYLLSIAIDSEDQDVLNRYIKTFKSRISIVEKMI